MTNPQRREILAPYRIAVVIPAYNEQDRLPGTLAKIAVAQIPGFEVAQIYVAENGSNDNTAAVAAAVGERLEPGADRP